MVISSQIAVNRQERKRRSGTIPASSGPRPTLDRPDLRAQRATGAAECLAALKAQSEPADEILVIDDGSTDSMVDWLTREFGVVFDRPGESALGTSSLWPALRVLRKPNSGKADSLNLGWKQAQGEIIVTLDADTYVEPGALAAIRDGFMEDPAMGIAAACSCRSASGPRGRGSSSFSRPSSMRAAFSGG